MKKGPFISLMKLPSIEVLQLVGTRLGFGSLKAGASIVVEGPSSDPEDQGLSTHSGPKAPPADPNWLSARPLAAHEELAKDFAEATAPFPTKKQPSTAVLEQPGSLGRPAGEDRGSRDNVGQLLAQLSFNTTFHETAPPAPPAFARSSVTDPQPAPAVSKLAVRALVVGFPTGQRPRIQQTLSPTVAAEVAFLALESLSDRMAEVDTADLLLLNIASVNVVQRNRKELLDLIAAGRAVLLTGSRVAMKQLGIDAAEDSNWDFQPIPWDPDEMTWRARRLLSQNGKPAAIAPPPPPSVSQSPTAASTATSAALAEVGAASIRTIVIADHDPITRSLVESTLALPGMVSVSATEDGETALARVKELRPDVLVMDLSLPNRDGFQLLAEIRRSKDLLKTRIIVLSARQAEVDILRAFGLGADDYVAKPFSPLELRARVQRLIVRGGVE